MSKHYVLILNNQEYKIQFSLKLFNKMGESICEELVKNEKYFVQSKVSNENFQIFLEFLNNKIQYPEISMSNYYDYLLLSEEFNKSLSNYLSKQEFSNIKNLCILKNAQIESRDKSYIEEYIAEHLDYYLEFFSKEMSQIPYTTLYNIFQHKKRILNNQERAYKFIHEILIKNDNENNTNFNSNHKEICILLKTLDATKISEESFKESFSKAEENFGFAPKFCLSFVSELKNQMSILMNQQTQMMNEIKELFDQQFAKKMDETKNEIKNLSQKVEKIENKVDQIIRNDEEMKNKVEQIIEEDCKLKIGVENLSQKVVNIESEVKQTHIGNEEMKSKVEQIIGEDCKIKIDVENLSQKVVNIEREVKQIFNKNEQIEDIWKLSFAKMGLFNGIIRHLTNECGGNVSEKGVVCVTASDMSNLTWGNLNNIVDFDNPNLFGTKNSKDSWIKYDFKSKKVCPICYLIRSCSWSKDSYHPKSWVVEGSNSDSSNGWTVLDSIQDNLLLNEPKAVKCFSIRKFGEFYRYLRIRQTGPNVGNSNFFSISSLEYFGSIQ